MKKIYFYFGLCITLSNCAATQHKPDEQAAITTPAVTVAPPKTFGVYGNWCGLDYPKDISRAAPPIDELDANCMRHDLCYVEQGQFACSCDKIFEEKLGEDLLENKYQGMQKFYARSFRQYFIGSLCNGIPEGKFGPSRALQNAYMNTTQKAMGVYHHIVGNNELDNNTLDNNEEPQDDGATVTVDSQNIKTKPLKVKPNVNK